MSAPSRLIAAVSTSATVWSVWLGVAADDPERRHASIAGDRGRPRDLLGTLQRLLAARGADLADVRGYALDVGPGSFTGLRSGMAAVRALAWAHGVPVCAVPSWHAMARAATPDPHAGVLCAVPARAGVWYLARWPGGTAQAIAAADVAAWICANAQPGDRTAGSAWSDPELNGVAGGLPAEQPDRAATDCSARWIATIALEGTACAWAEATAVLPSYVAVSEAENRERSAQPPPCGRLPERAQ